MASLTPAPLYSVPQLFAEDLISLAITAGLMIWVGITWWRMGMKKDRFKRGLLILATVVLSGFGIVAVVNLVQGRPKLDMHEEGMCYYARSGHNHALPWRDIARIEKYRSPRRDLDTWVNNRNQRRGDNYGDVDLIAGFRLSLWSCRGEQCISFINTRYSAEDEAMALSLWRKAQMAPAPERLLECNRLKPTFGWPWIKDFIRR